MHLDRAPPFLVVKAQMCEFFGCLPSSLSEEETDTVLPMWQAYQLYESAKEEKRTRKG